MALAVLLLFGPAVWKSAASSAAAQSAANATKEKKKLNFELQVVGPDGKPVPRARVDIRCSPGADSRADQARRIHESIVGRSNRKG